MTVALMLAGLTGATEPASAATPIKSVSASAIVKGETNAIVPPPAAPRQIRIEAMIFAIESPGSRIHRKEQVTRQGPKPIRLLSGSEAISHARVLWLTNFISTSTNESTIRRPTGFTYVAELAEDLPALIAALTNESRVRVLYERPFQTSDGLGVTIFLGETEPLPRGYPDRSQGGPSPCGPALETGIGLELTPSIYPDGLLSIGIRQTIDEIAGITEIPNVGEVPNTLATELRATVTVRDRGTFMIGGVMKNSARRRSSGVPVLKSIPLLGALFRGSSASRPQREFVVLFRPSVIPD